MIRRIFTIFLAISLAVCILAGVLMATEYFKVNENQKIKEEWKSYELILNQPLTLKSSEFPHHGNRPLTVLRNYNSPQFNTYDNWTIDLAVELQGAEAKNWIVTSRYFASSFSDPLAKFNTTEGQTIKLTLLKLANLPNETSIQILVGRDYDKKAAAMERMGHDILEIFLIIDGLFTAILACILIVIRKKTLT